MTSRKIWAGYEPKPEDPGLIASRRALANAQPESKRAAKPVTPQVPPLAGMAPLGLKPQPAKPAPCGFKAWDMMPSCVLPAGHAGDHEDGFGGHYTHLDPAADPLLAVQIDLFPCFKEDK